MTREPEPRPFSGRLLGLSLMGLSLAVCLLAVLVAGRVRQVRDQMCAATDHGNRGLLATACPAIEGPTQAVNPLRALFPQPQRECQACHASTSLAANLAPAASAKKAPKKVSSPVPECPGAHGQVPATRTGCANCHAGGI
jgi:hypothetical protein